MLVPGNFSSVFDDYSDTETEFDTMFGGEEDDDLMNAVAGFTESGDPAHLPEEDELHHNEDDTDFVNFGDELGPHHDTSNKPTEDPATKETEYDTEENIALVAGDESEAREFYNDEDDNYQNGSSDKNAPIDPEDLEGASSNAMDEWVDDIFSEGGDFDDDLDDPDLDEGDEEVDESSFFWEGTEEDDEDDLISAAEKSDSGKSNKDLSYNNEDEELIDMVSDGN